MEPDPQPAKPVSAAGQYARGDLLPRLLGALAAAGRDPEHLGPDDLVEVEEFHTMGRPATRAVAQAAGLAADDDVLDLGSGLGGPARTIARSCRCRVTGLDLTAEFCDIAQEFNRRSGFGPQDVRIVEGDATALPFSGGSFSAVVTQHVSMNIADKALLFSEARRVLRAGGRLVFFDYLAGDGGPVYTPIMWADDPAWSFLASETQTRDLLRDSRFEISLWEDLSAQGQAFFVEAASQMAAAMAAGKPPVLGMHLVIPNLPLKGANTVRSLAEGRIRLVRCVAAAV